MSQFKCMRLRYCCWAMCLLIGSTYPAFAESVYLTQEEFLTSAFSQKVPEVQELWHTKELRAEVKALIGRNPFGARSKYWHANERSAWILEEIGKEEVITFGVIVSANKIERIQVLVYRESRGWEIRSEAFARQFLGASLTGDKKLSQQIDGITGATLSVRAMEKMARLALLFHRKIEKQ